MHVLLIGGGGREHALAWKLAQSPLLQTLSTDRPLAGLHGPVLPAGADPVVWAQDQGVDLVVVGPEAPLAQGLVDRLEAAGVPAFGPKAAGARLESSKAFAKDFMAAQGIPTAEAVVCTSAGQARAAATGPCVVKADGLAAGKGVFVVDTAEEAAAAIDAIFGGRFGSAGARVLVEERLTGPEVSVLALCDGRRAVPLLPCRDHKRRHEGDRGPNTGGMGAVCPPPGVDAALVEQVRRDVLQPVVDGMAAQGTPFRGVLYAGLMLTPAGPKVLEFNVRFGDPECQPLMMMLDEDLLPLLQACATGRLPERALRWHEGAAACVVLCAEGYPASARKGDRIEGAELSEDSAEMVFFAGVRRDGDALYTAGGRVLGVTARGSSLPLALQRAYARVARIRFNGADWRRDIGDSPVC
jgi:phosphoribosylamine--glycine ligase